MAVVVLNLQQSNEILAVLASLKWSAHLAKLCYSDTALCLESDSSLWRTAAEKYNMYITSLFSQISWNRDITVLPALISRVVTCLMLEVKTPEDIEKTVFNLRNAQDGLLQLREQQYPTGDKGVLISKAFHSLLFARVQLEKKLPNPPITEIYPRFTEKSDAQLNLENMSLRLDVMTKDLQILAHYDRIQALEQALKQVQPDHPILNRKIPSHSSV